MVRALRDWSAVGPEGYDGAALPPPPERIRGPFPGPAAQAAERDAAIEAVAEARPRSVDFLLGLIRKVAEAQAMLHCNDIWPLVAPERIPAEKRVLGPAFQSAARLGWIVATDEMRPNALAARSGRSAMKTVWRSLLFEEGDPDA